MNFVKHVGKHNDRKVVVLYREVPNEDHMCLVANSDLLPRLVHDEVMKVLESPSGQAADSFADALFRNIMADGRNTLEVLHREGFIKKVPTNQIIMTPTTKAKVRLDELNTILNEMKQGEEAIKRLQDIDNQAGMAPKKRVREGREVGMPPNNQSLSRTNIDTESTTSAAAYVKGALTDDDLAADRLRQAENMKAQAEQLLAEARRLEQEADNLSPAKNVKTTRAKKAPTAKKQTA